MKNQQFVVIIGDLSKPVISSAGIRTVHGPFKDREHANQWVSVHAGRQPYLILPLKSFGA